MRLVHLAALVSVVVAAACREHPTAARQVSPDCTVEGPTVSPSSASVHTGDTLRAQVRYTPCPAGPVLAFRWRSSDTAVAVVDSSGLIAARSAGQATVIASEEVNPQVEGALVLQVLAR